jgi:hypothetical protein
MKLVLLIMDLVAEGIIYFRERYKHHDRKQKERDKKKREWKSNLGTGGK